jgi:hypothetical protein
MGQCSRYLLRDRDCNFGHDFVEQVKAMGIKQVLSAPRSPCVTAESRATRKLGPAGAISDSACSHFSNVGPSRCLGRS